MSNAISGIASSLQGAGSTTPMSGPSGNPVQGFSTVLEQAAENAINTGHVAERNTALALSGKGNTTDMVSSVEEAKLTLQTTTALRDRAVSSYQEVMRMNI